MFMMDIAQSDDADRLLRSLDMLKDDTLEAADAAVRAPDPVLSEWPPAEGSAPRGFGSWGRRVLGR